MTTRMQFRALAITVLLAAAILTHSLNAFGAPLLVFGLFNAVFDPPGTAWVRWLAIGATVFALANPLAYVLMALLMWLIWPPAFAVAWAVGNRSPVADGAGNEPPMTSLRARVALAGIVAAVAIGSASYRLIVLHGLQQTAVLFIGLPAIIAVIVILLVKPTSARGVSVKAVTVGLLVSTIFMGEGVLCIVMSAPLFFLVALAAGSVAERIADRRSSRATHTLSCIVIVAIVPLSLEGVTDFTTVARRESVSVSRIVHAPLTAVSRALFAAPRFDRVMPLYLRAGFPSPTATRIDRSGDTWRWVIEMRGGEMRASGMEPRTGDLVLTLEESRPGRVRWRAVSDTSHMTHFLNWRDSIVEWTPIDVQTTEVTWTLSYDRGLDPAWYFGPIERYAMRLAAGYLIDSVATP